MTKRPYLSVVIPCYNERENLERGVLEEVENFLGKQRFSWEVIVSDDGSTDNSRELVKKAVIGKAGFRLVENLHGGKPSAVWGGIKEAKGEYVLFSDMDQSAPLKEVSKLMPFFDEYEVVIGSRGSIRENFGVLRKVGSVAFRLIRQAFFLRGIKDTQCGFKALRAEVAKEIFPRLEFFRQKKQVRGWKVTSFDVELLFLAEKFGYKIKEVAVEWKDRDVSTSKKKSYLKESLEMLKQIFRVKLNDLKGLYSIN
ncbi:MAG TPA: glycosyltransferase [Clostridia bacterium]|nr:glycosyltransferase [Clostridia bacterium]